MSLTSPSVPKASSRLSCGDDIRHASILPPQQSRQLGKFAAVRTASTLILRGKARSDDTDELGADFMGAPPDHLVCAFPDNTVTGQEQHELIGNVESRDMKSHAAVGNVECSRALECEFRPLSSPDGRAGGVATGVSPYVSASALVDGSEFWPPQHLSVKLQYRTAFYGPPEGRARIFLAFAWNC